jgi:hypothetical protein
LSDNDPISIVESLDDHPDGPLVKLWRLKGNEGLLALLTIGWFGEDGQSVTLTTDQIAVLIDFLDEYRPLFEGDDDDPSEQRVAPPPNNVISLDEARRKVGIAACS